MRLKEKLKEDKDKLSLAWFDKLLESYPEETRKYFSKTNASFTNPIGYNIRHCLNNILDELLKESPDSDVLNEELKMILRIKAVQEVLPSQAVSFVPALKQTIERHYKIDRLVSETSLAEVLDFYSDLDTVALYAYDLYVESKMLIYDLRLTQIKETNDLLIKANLLNEELDMSSFMRCSTKLDCQSEDCTGCGEEKTK